MKKMFTPFIILIIILMFTGIISNLRAEDIIFKDVSDPQQVQKVKDALASNSKEQVTEGKDYWFGLPHCKMKQQEPIRGEYPIVVWLFSKVPTNATLRDTLTGKVFSVKVLPHIATQIPMSDLLMNTESEVIRNYGIHVTSDAPISVVVYLSYKWSGEAFRVIPVEWLGKNYVTTNMYQDRTDEYKPAQILIIATQDNTVVNYIPSAETERGVKKGATGKTTLMKGQTFLIEAKIFPNLNQSWKTDLSGTRISATKPIAVISGHSKGAFPRYNPGMPNNYQYRYANFLRNMLVEMVWPVELLGKEYISAPIKYTARPRGLTSIQDDAGDLIRFVAAYDSTEVYQLRQNGQGFLKINSKPLMAGDWFDITNQENPAYYKATKPVLVGQYGKTWWNEDIPGNPDDTKTKGGDDPQNPHRNGQGMLIVLAPLDHWCSYAAFRSPEQIDNFFYITFRTAHMNKIKFDDKALSVAFGGAIKEITNTPYSYLAEPIRSGDHWIEGFDSATFAGYAYGNWDYTKDGFAYGYPIGINYAMFCNDTMIVKDTLICGDVNAIVDALDLQKDTSCAAIFNIYLNGDPVNYDFQIDPKFIPGTQHTKYSLKVKDYKQPASASVIIMSRSGYQIIRDYSYIPEAIQVTPNPVNFGTLKVGDKVVKTFDIMNPDTAHKPMTVYKLYLRDNKAEYSLDTAGMMPFTLMPGQKKTITATATAKTFTDKPVIDYVMAQLSCFEKLIDTLKYVMNDPSVYVEDFEFGSIPVKTTKTLKRSIINQSKSVVYVYSITWSNKTNFPKTSIDNISASNPIVIQPLGTYDFTVDFTTNVAGVDYYDTAYITSNATKTKLWSAWHGKGLDAGPLVIGYDWPKLRIIDSVAKFANVTEYKGKVYITCTGNSKIGITDVVPSGDADGVFRIEHPIPVNELKPGDTVALNAFFAPKAEKSYNANVKFIATTPTGDAEVTDRLTGIGGLPHINVVGKDFGAPILVNTTKLDSGAIEHYPVNGIYALKLAIDKFSITGPDANVFEIDPAFITAHKLPDTIQIGGSWGVPIIFKPTKSGKFTAYLTTQSDATDTTDIKYDKITAQAYIQGINTTDIDYQTIFRKATKKGTVTLANHGDYAVEIIKDIDQSLVGNPTTFKIDSWETTSLPNSPKAPFKLSKDEVLTVHVTFEPPDEGSYNARIDYQMKDTVANSKLVGNGKVIRILTYVPTGYKDLPDRTIIMDYRIKRDENSQDFLAKFKEANITSFEARVVFHDISKSNVFDVRPYITGSNSIIMENTITGGNGWTCTNANITGLDTMVVQMQSSKPLEMSGDESLLFRFPMHTYLSDLNTIPLPVEFKVNGEPAKYVIVQTNPGDVAIDPVCKNTIRLIELANNSGIGIVMPNPVSTKTTVQYAVAKEGMATISLYNNLGEKVAELLNGKLGQGLYELEVNVDKLNISSGNYIIELRTGNETFTKRMLIEK